MDDALIVRSRQGLGELPSNGTCVAPRSRRRAGGAKLREVCRALAVATGCAD
jgi:hypothetical protein